MPDSLIEIIRRGGCYWKREQYDSPGHSIAIPNGTIFRIAVEGPQSHQFTKGTCCDGYFVIDEGEHAGSKCESANEAVNTVRVPSSNAFLYLHFKIGESWVVADELRRSESTKLDAVEEMALEEAIMAIRQKMKGTKLTHVEMIRKAADVVAKNPSLIRVARLRREAIDDLSV